MDFTPLFITAPFVGILLASGEWAERRFARFDELPGHFDFRGRASRMTPRRTMVWLLPVTFSIMLVILAILTGLMAGAEAKPASLGGTFVSIAAVMAGQLLFLILTSRWAAAQP